MREYIVGFTDDADMERFERIHGTNGELIRCKDCIYWKRYCRVVDGVTSHHVCGLKRELDGMMHRSEADDFCSWVERKEE